ncbi:hypothetical protein CgunFtcFv8_015409 [Champsocephalus gunnari]|uniref:Chemokine interleukin-8-like domain-containing protein n=1 Tax=Champsocephalus gunnari TaxID=52237 RepID=A0AAN8C6L8_CHAGU|nr:hypothetical protein CgunFtcFv8_015409 [Champsocephalus gunnari]
MLLSVSKVGAWGQPLTCRKKCTNFKVQRIQSCVEQMQRRNCKHAFVVTNKRGTRCIKPDAVWLKEMINRGELHCPPDIHL